MRTYTKYVSEKIRRGIDWSDSLIDGDEVVSAEWIVSQGLTGLSAAFGQDYADIDLEGGTVGEQYKVTNNVSTSEGLEYSRSFMVLVR